MWDLRVCRGCLVTDTEGKLEPLNKMLKMGYQALTGLEMKDGDGYPTYFCLECCVHIKKAWAFRRKSRRAFFVMREIMIIRNEVTIKDIQTINRDKTHLNSTSSYWNLKNNTIFNIDNTEDEECSMVKYTPVIKNLVCHSIEVIPDITNNIEEDEVEAALEDTIDNVDDANDNENDNIPAEIDLEDVFKDLKEESSAESELEELELIKAEKPAEKKVEKKKEIVQNPSKVFNFKAFDIRVNNACKALSNTNIVVLSDVDQKSMHVIRSKMHGFLTAKFKCALCLIVFENINALMKHVEDHKAWQGDYVCSVCKNKFSTEEQLHIHKVENHLYEYTCKICSQIMYTVIEVIKHNEEKHPEVLKSTLFKMTSLKSHFKYIRLKHNSMYAHSTSILSCKSCMKHFRTRHDFADHVSNHEGKPLYYCDICLKCNRSKGGLQEHMIKFHLYSYRCKQCAQKFPNRYKARNHVRSGFCRQTSQVIKCDICHAKTTSKLNLMGHQMYMHYSQVYLYECNLCGHSYTTLVSLYKHQITIHKYISPMDPMLGDPEHTCRICNYQFYSRRAYQKHVVRANHPEVLQFGNACRPCRRLFDSEEQRKNHACSRTTRLEYPRVCDLCDQILIDDSEREKHYTAYHPQQSYAKRTLCQICGRLVSKFRYGRHMRNHSGDLLDKYECSRCDPATSWPNVYGYVEHVIASHTHKPYHCTVCYAAFRYKSVCRDHILKAHEPAKLYVCRHCEQPFAHRDYLIDHSKTVHNVKMRKIKQDRLRKNIYVYPHMKIDVSLVETEILKIIKFDLYDYIHKKYEELDDPTNHLITDTFFQRTQPSTMKRRAPYTGAKKVKKPKLSVDDIKKEECIVTTRTVIFDKRSKSKTGANENKHVLKVEENVAYGTEDMGYNESVLASEFLVHNKDIDKKEDKIDAYENGVKVDAYENDVIQYGDDNNSEVKNILPNIKNEMVGESQVPGVIEETIEQELEVFDIDGQNYVMLDGILYKVETE